MACPKCGASIAAGAKFCGACGAPVILPEQPAAAFCSQCGTKNESGAKFCKSCGEPLTTEAAAGRPANVSLPNDMSPASNKIAAGICGILLGGLGVHKFILGYGRAGAIMLSITLGCFVGGLLTCGLLWPAIGDMQIIGLIEGIIYLTKSDEDFVRTYVDGHKEWF